MKIKRVAISELHHDPSNARVHDERNLGAIGGSLKTFGQVEPLVVQAGTGRVIGGNGRLTVLKEMGVTEVEIVEVDVDDAQATALGITLNRTAETAAWDEEVLARHLEALRELPDFDVLVTGFDEDEIAGLLHLDEAGGLEDDDVPEPPADPITKPGDLWILGDHRLLCGDSTKAEDLARLMDGETATLFSTDPPYCVNYTGKDRPIHDGKPSGKDWSHVYREVDIEDLGEFLDAVFTACLPHVEPAAGIYIWHAHVQQPTIAATFEKHELLLHQVLVWVKPTATFGHCFYRWKHEPCAFGWRRGNKPTHGLGKLETVWEVDWEGKARVVGNEHPTQKPLKLFGIPMDVHTRRGDLVLEPFSGSGSQLIAAEKMGRRCRAMEIAPAFVDVAVQRWKSLTGKKADRA